MFIEDIYNGTYYLIDKIIDSFINNKSYFINNGFSEFSNVYYFTNENINKSLSYINKDSSIFNAISVLSSGDHVFNLINNGVFNIDSFDINRLCEYYALGFKRSMILKYDYKDFINIMKNISFNNCPSSYVNDLLFELYPYMDSKYRDFFNNIIDYINKRNNELNIDINALSIMDHKYYFDNCTINNNYLLNEIEYNQLKTNINKANISYTCCDYNELDNKFKNKYDLIVLSNILDYAYCNWDLFWKYDKLLDYENRLNKLLNDNGNLLLHYIFDYYYQKNNPIQLSGVKSNDLLCEQVISFDGSFDKKNGLILVKK